MEKQKQAPRAQNRAPKGPTGPIYGQIEDLRANSPEDPTHAFAPGGVFGAVVSGPIPFITKILKGINLTKALKAKDPYKPYIITKDKASKYKSHI